MGAAATGHHATGPTAGALAADTSKGPWRPGWLVAGLVVAVAIVGGVAVAMQGGDDAVSPTAVATTPAPTATTPAPTAAQTVAMGSTPPATPQQASPSQSDSEVADPVGALRVELFCDQVDVDAVAVVLGEPVTETFAIPEGETFPAEYNLPVAVPVLANTCDYWGTQVTARDDSGGTITNQSFRPLVRLSVGDTNSEVLADGFLDDCQVADLDDFGNVARTATCADTFLTLIDFSTISTTAKFGSVELTCAVDLEGPDGPSVQPELIQLCRDVALLLAA